MNQRIASIALVVKDYDEAIAFYTKKLDFNLVEDTYLPIEDKRWVIVSPRGPKGCNPLLARAANAEQEKAIGNQAGGRVFLFLFTDDFWRDYEAYKSRGVEFIRPPKKEGYGTVAVFVDLYGNKWDLLEPSAENSAN